MESVLHGVVLPAYAGMIPAHDRVDALRHGAPRIRGDDPSSDYQLQGSEGVLPAYAGMILRNEAADSRRLGAPRIRGDDPVKEKGTVNTKACSPHTRG